MEVSFAETYLEYPELFPARASGEVWGGHELAVDLPGGPYFFGGLSAAQEDMLRSRLGSLCVASGARPASVESVLFRVAGAEFLAIDTRGWEYAVDVDFAPRSVRLAGLGLMGRLDLDSRLSGALWTSADAGERFYGAFENYFRLLFAYRLLECGGALLHSAGVLSGGRAFLFLGRSGAGKSTLSRLSVERGKALLSDDLNALVPGPEGALVERLPFAGDFRTEQPRRESHPLRALCRLEKGSSQNALRPMGAAELLAALLACASGVNQDPYRRERLISNLESLARGVPAAVLTFSRDGGFWPLLERGWS